MIYPKVWPKVNFPKEDKPHNLRVDVVDLAARQLQLSDSQHSVVRLCHSGG